MSHAGGEEVHSSRSGFGRFRLTPPLSDRRLYRRRNVLTRADVSLFVRRLFYEIVGSNIQYDAVTAALQQSGIVPHSAIECCTDCAEADQQRINSLADALFKKIQASVSVHAAIAAAAKSVLDDFTIPPPKPERCDRRFGPLRGHRA